jgi:hypothetical protein
METHEHKTTTVTWDNKVRVLQKVATGKKCLMLCSGIFPGVCSLNANVSEHSVRSIFIGE